MTVARANGTGLLLLNLGTPRSPATHDVRAYLREFLSDPRVLDMPAPARWLLLNLVVLPFRTPRSAHAYRQIWTERGSPLRAHGEELRDKVAGRLGAGTPVALAMRYGEPSIAVALAELRERGVRRLTLFPLFPQHSAAATESAEEAVRAAAADLRGDAPSIEVVPACFDHPRYLGAAAEAARPALAAADAERVVFSFHGLPERQVRKADASGRCLADAGCCAVGGEANRRCYRAQCLATARALGEALGVPEERRVAAFQSRFGRDRWIGPHTDRALVALAREGVKRVAVVSPGFAADCLETLEEIGIRGAAAFREHGGERLTLAPCLNASDAWADAVAAIARETSPALGGS